MVRLTLLGAVVALAACTSAEEQAARVEREANADLIIAARIRLEEQLRDPGSAEYSDVAVYIGSDGQRRVCGYVNAANAYGGKTGRQPFIAGGGEAFLGEGENEAAVRLAWPTACVDRQPN